MSAMHSALLLRADVLFGVPWLYWANKLTMTFNHLHLYLGRGGVAVRMMPQDRKDVGSIPVDVNTFIFLR